MEKGSIGFHCATLNGVQFKLEKMLIYGIFLQHFGMAVVFMQLLIMNFKPYISRNRHVVRKSICKTENNLV